mgnify:CR=1 FL=1
MVKHIILWTLNDMEKDKKETVKQEIKKSLESLNGKIPGLIDLKITASETLSSSTADLMLDSTFESPEALKNYSIHPEHTAIANSKVRPYTKLRSCLDFQF